MLCAFCSYNVGQHPLERRDCSCGAPLCKSCFERDYHGKNGHVSGAESMLRKSQSIQTDGAKLSKSAVVGGVIRPKPYPLMVEAVEIGVAYGYSRAHKHTSEPTEEALKDAMVDAVMSAICDRFDFDGGEER